MPVRMKILKQINNLLHILLTYILMYEQLDMISGEKSMDYAYLTAFLATAFQII